MSGHILSASQFHLTDSLQESCPKVTLGARWTPTVCLMMRSAKKRQLELCMGLTEASMCQELVELETGEGGQREKTLEMLAMGTVWEEYGGLFV